jgi:hypothetical protein
MTKKPLSSAQTARDMLRVSTLAVRDAQADLLRVNLRIRDDFGALRRWHSSEYQTIDGVRYVGDYTAPDGTVTSVTDSFWRECVADSEQNAAQLRGPLVAALQAANARLGYWRAECARLTAKASA